MKVGIVCLHTDPFADPGSGDVGGMNVVVRNTCTAMAADGVEVSVITRHSDPNVPAEQEIEGVRVHRIAIGPVTTIPKGAHEAVIDPFSRALARLGPYDLLHSHHWFSGMAALPVARSQGIPHVQSFHSIAASPRTPLAEGERPESPGRLMGEAFLAKESDAVVAVSNAEARTAISRLGAEPERVTVAHPGVDSARFHPDMEEVVDGDPCLGIPTSITRSARPSLLVAARLEPLKGLDLAIRTLALLPQPRPVLRVAGGVTADDGHLESLQVLAAELGVTGDVQFLGPLNRCDLAEAMRKATIMLVPSHSETYGLVALEASASGIPVVASPAGGLVEAVHDGVTGLLVPTRDPQEWAEVIGSLLADPVRRARLGGAGRTEALRRTWQREARTVLACYDRLLAPVAR